MATALASLSDVKRVLRIADTVTDNDAAIQGALDAINAWAAGQLAWVPEGIGVETYFDVYDNQTLHLPAPDVVVTKVKIFPSRTDDEIFFWFFSDSENAYEQTDDGRLILRSATLMEPFEGAVATRMPNLYGRVDVHYEATGVVPRDLTEGIAFLAAGYWQQGPTILSGLTGEKIGDYSYTGERTKPGDDPQYVSAAQMFLSRYMVKRRVSVT